MNGHFRAKDPDDIEFTLTLTATLGEWTEIRQVLKDADRRTCATSQLMNIIWDTAKQAEAVYHQSDI